jgi:TonB family protein
MKKPVLIFVAVAAIGSAAWYFTQRDNGVDAVGSLGGTMIDGTDPSDGIPAGSPAADSATDESTLADTNEPAGPLQVGGEVLAPVRIHAPQPQYTEAAERARIQGVAIAQAIIDKEGNVTDVKILKGLAMGLDQEAAKAIRAWKFEPATRNGDPVSVYYTITLHFSLQ